MNELMSELINACMHAGSYVRGREHGAGKLILWQDSVFEGQVVVRALTRSHAHAIHSSFTLIFWLFFYNCDYTTQHNTSQCIIACASVVVILIVVVIITNLLSLSAVQGWPVRVWRELRVRAPVESAGGAVSDARRGG